jgi:hypothetical protein
MKSMENSQNFPMEGKVDVNEKYVGGQDDESIGRNKGKKKIIGCRCRTERERRFPYLWPYC